MYYLYILRSEKSGTYYVGISENPENRLKYHNTIEKGFTARYRPWVLVFSQTFQDKGGAAAAEKMIKKMKSRVFIEKVISGEYQVS